MRPFFFTVNTLLNLLHYASLWSPLLQKSAREKNEKFKIRILNSFPIYPDAPIHVEIISTVNGHPVLLDDSLSIPLTEHVLIDNTWKEKTWAGEPGWHQFSADSTIVHYFISEESGWKELHSQNQMEANKAVSAPVTKVYQSVIIHERKTISLLIFYLAFLFASGFLWFAPKI